MDTDRQVELLYDSLKHEYTVYIDDVIKSMGFLIVALGWVLTSDGARKALHSFKTIACFCVIVLAVNTAGMVIGHYVRSRRIQKSLRQSLRKVEPEMQETLIKNYSIVTSHMVENIFTFGPLYTVLIVLILTPPAQT